MKAQTNGDTNLIWEGFAEREDTLASPLAQSPNRPTQYTTLPGQWSRCVIEEVHAYQDRDVIFNGMLI